MVDRFKDIDPEVARVAPPDNPFGGVPEGGVLDPTIGETPPPAEPGENGDTTPPEGETPPPPEGEGTPPAEGEETTPPAEGETPLPGEEGDGEGTPAALQSMLDFLRGLFVDAEQRQTYLANPGQVLQQAGFGDVSGADVHDALAIVCDTLPPEQAAALSPYVNQSYSGPGGGGYGGGGGGGGMVVQEAIQEINYAINLSYVDDRDNIIQDNDTNIAVGYGEGDVGITVDEENQYAAAGDDATNVDVDAVTMTPEDLQPPEEEPPGEGEVPPEEPPEEPVEEPVLMNQDPIPVEEEPPPPPPEPDIVG